MEVKKYRTTTILNALLSTNVKKIDKEKLKVFVYEQAVSNISAVKLKISVREYDPPPGHQSGKGT